MANTNNSKKSSKKQEPEMDSHDCNGDCVGSYVMGPEMIYDSKSEVYSSVFVKIAAAIMMLAIAFYLGSQFWGTPWQKGIRAEVTSAPYARTITVDGDGKLTVKPDIARISLSVASTGLTVGDVTKDGNEKMNAVITELKALGIKADDIKTTSYNLYPQYNRKTPVYYGQSSDEEAETPQIVGYNLNQSVEVKVRDLNSTDEVLDKATEVGANQVGSLTFDIDDPSGFKANARELAFGKARDKAEQMAKAAGVGLGRVVTFSEGYTGGYVNQYANYAVRSMDMAEESAVPSAALEPGSQEVTVNVSVTYEID